MWLCAVDDWLRVRMWLCAVMKCFVLVMDPKLIEWLCAVYVWLRADIVLLRAGVIA